MIASLFDSKNTSTCCQGRQNMHFSGNVRTFCLIVCVCVCVLFFENNNPFDRFNFWTRQFLCHLIMFLYRGSALWLLMLLCPGDEASRPLLGRCVSLLYWCEDRPLGPPAFCSPESNKSMACCSLYCTQHSFTNTQINYIVDTLKETTISFGEQHDPPHTAVFHVFLSKNNRD